MNLEHFERLGTLIQEAGNNGVFVRVPGLTGFSGEALLGMLQRLAQYQESINAGCYLEVGVFKGLSLISVANALENGPAIGIDNFAQFDPGHKNQEIIEANIQAHHLHHVSLVNMDYEDALGDLGRVIGDIEVGTYFVDGPHDYRSQLICLQLAKPYLSDNAVIIIDDCNYRHVRLANSDFLKANPEFRLLFEAYTPCHPDNMAKSDEELARKGWWNGVNVIVRDPKGILDKIYPPTLRDRCLYENEHVIHGARYGFLAPEALSFFSSVGALRPVAALKTLARMIANSRRNGREWVGRYPSMNTFSEELPRNNLNPSLTCSLDAQSVTSLTNSEG